MRWITLASILAWLFSSAAANESNTNWIGAQAETNRVVSAALDQHVREMFESLSEEGRAGYRLLTEKVYLPADFDEEVLTRLDRLGDAPPFNDVGPPRDDRQRTWSRYGLTARIGDSSKPLQYVVREDGQYVMNCFACHGGSVYGSVFPGAPNTLYGLESLTEQVRRAKLSLKKPITHMDVGSAFMPLGTTVGTSNAVMFGVALMNFRDKDLNVVVERPAPELSNHDMDAPAWWHFHRKKYLYIDGFAAKNHRGLMQFMLVKENGPKQFQAWEEDFRKVYAFMQEIRPPRYPLPVDQALAEKGRERFETYCSSCHGTYGQSTDYPEMMVPIDEIGTDRVRYDALTERHRAGYGASWFARFGEDANREDVTGYVAPPLDGIWASAPYFHNGSVPTLWQVLNPAERPKIWRRIGLGMNTQEIGLQYEVLEATPAGLGSYQRRWVFDTRQNGKSAEGHDFVNVLNHEEKLAVLEYLKTL